MMDPKQANSSISEGLHSVVTITDAAVERVAQIKKIQSTPDYKFRVYITGGGCYGFQYGFNLVKEQQPDDIVIDFPGVEVIIDPLSFQYLEGCIVDFKKDLQGARFVVENPKAQGVCGCGSSFAV